MTSSSKDLDLEVIEDPTTLPEDLDYSTEDSVVMIEHEGIAYFGVIKQDMHADPLDAFQWIDLKVEDEETAKDRCHYRCSDPWETAEVYGLFSVHESFFEVARNSTQFRTWAENRFGKSVTETNGGFAIAANEAMRMVSIEDDDDDEQEDMQHLLSESDVQEYLFNRVDQSPDEVLIHLSDYRYYYHAQFADADDAPSMLLDIKNKEWIEDTKKVAAAIKQALDAGTAPGVFDHGYCGEQRLIDVFEHAKAVKAVGRDLSIGEITSLVKRAVLKSSLDEYNQRAEGDVHVIHTYSAPILSRDEYDEPEYGPVSEVEDGCVGGVIGSDYAKGDGFKDIVAQEIRYLERQSQENQQKAA